MLHFSFPYTYEQRESYPASEHLFLSNVLQARLIRFRKPSNPYYRHRLFEILSFLSETCVLLQSFPLSWASLLAFGLKPSPSRSPRAEIWPSPPRSEAQNHPPRIMDRSRVIQCYCTAGRYYRFPVVSPDSACVFQRAELTRRPGSLAGNHVRSSPFDSFDSS